MIHYFIKNNYFFLSFVIAINITLAFSSNAKSIDTLSIAIPVNEEVLIKNDPYFVHLKRAYKSLNIPVEFIIMPGARSYRMLLKGKISGSYPRYTSIAFNSEVLSITGGFEIEQNIYAFSFTPIDSKDVVEYALSHRPDKIGTVRGIKVVEYYVGENKIRLFNHIDHLIGAFKEGKVDIILETEAVMQRYEDNSTPFYRSPKPIVKGKITQVLHKNHQDIIEKLANHFAKQSIN